MRKRFILSVLLLMGIAFTPCFAQDIDQMVSSYLGDNGQGYMKPLGDAFGSLLNSGFYHSARIKKGFHLSLDVHSMLAQISDEQRVFKATTEGGFSPVQTVEAPTIFGKAEPVFVNGIAGTFYAFPSGLNVARMPLAVPQVTIGALFGTEATVRFMQMDLGDNFKQLKLLGYGIRHSVSQYIPACPVDLAAAVYMQQFKIGDIVDASALYYGVQASKKISLLTLYGGIGIGQSSMKIRYENDSTADPVAIAFDLDSDAKMCATAGLCVDLGGLYINADYNIGVQNILTAGLGFSF
jgi:hypothetical protein